MKEREYRKLQRLLNRYEDVDRVAADRGLDREMVFVAYTQNIVRDATKRFYVMKRNANKLLGEWRRGHSLLEIANVNHFPPVLTAQIILLTSGVGRKTFWKWVRGEDNPPNERLAREISEVADNDYVYSPQGNRLQKIRGLRGEHKLSLWLESKGCKYMNEDDLRGDSPKTPDCLLDEPIVVKGRRVNWIESKANFGDSLEIRRNMQRQLLPYSKIFGPGVVVYWLGYVEDHGQDEADVIIVDGKELTGNPGLDGVSEKMVQSEVDDSQFDSSE